MPAAASKDGRWTRLFQPGSRYHLLALAFFVVVFALIPFTIYAHSGEDWGFPFHRMLYISTIGLIFFACVACILRLTAAIHVGLARTTSYLLFFLGLFLLTSHVYAPIQIAPLDGTTIISDEPFHYTIIEVGLLVLSISVFVLLIRGRGLLIASIFSFILLLVSFGYAGILALSDDGEVQHAQAPTRSTPGIDANVYHIVLDTMQTDVFLSSIQASSSAEVFVGFEFFRNNISNYTTTVPSSASYFTSTFYRTGDFKAWTRDWRRKGLFPTLSGRGYAIWMYAPFSYWKSKHIDRFWYNVEIYEQENDWVGLYDLVHIWLASLAPNPLTDEAVPDAAALRDRIFALLTGKPKPLTIPEGLHPYAGALMLHRLLLEENLRPSNGQYVYAHAALPHGPFVLDRDCRYVGKPEKGVKTERMRTYLEQAQCSIKLVAEFLDKLRRRERYDAATIIVHADTGHGLGFVNGGSKLDGRKTLGVPDEQLLSSLNAFLMIKRPYAKGALKVVDTPTQLVDLFPTILDILDLKADYETQGRSVYALTPAERRHAVFGFDPNKKHGSNIVEVRIEDQSDLQNSKLTVLGPATDPATWRTADDGQPVR